MALKRGVLAKVDRRLFSELDHQEGVQLVKVPVSDGVWSTWRRFCDAVGVSMGRGLAVLLERELASVAEEDLDGLAERLKEGKRAIGAKEAELDERESQLDRREGDLRMWEARLEREDSQPAQHPWTPSKQGRNEPCWCGSDKKFKYCHGRTG